jgi:PAS domain S-box-containing protein
MPFNISDRQRSMEYEREPQEKTVSIEKPPISHPLAFRYRDLLESISEIVAVLDGELRYQFVNKAFVEAVHLPKTKVLNKTPTEIFPKIEQTSWYKTAKEVLANRKPLSVIAAYVYEDGRRKWYTSKIYPLPTGILSISTDVTEITEGEEEIRRQSNLIRTAADSMSDAIFILNTGSNPHGPAIVGCNAAALKLFGYDKKEILGKPTEFLLVNNESLLEFQRLLHSAVEKDQFPFDLPEVHMKRKDGTIFTTGHTVNRLLNDKGEQTGWVGIVRDITERKRLENELKKYTEHLEELVAERTGKLQESEERYRSVVENVPYVVWINRDKKTVYLSHNVSEILGYESDEILANDVLWSIKTHPEDLTKVVTALDALFDSNQPYDIEYRVQRKDGEWIWIHEKAVSSIKRDGARYTYGVFSDITDGFEYLISNNSFESFLKFLQIIRGRVQNHNAIVIAPLMEKAFEPRALGLIERETTILEPKTQDGSN